MSFTNSAFSLLYHFNISSPSTILIDSVVALKYDLKELTKDSIVWSLIENVLKDFSEINELIPAESYKRLVLFERANGSGPLKLNIHELSDLELIIWSMHKEISFKDDFETFKL